MTPQEFKKKWGVFGASLVIQETVHRYNIEKSNSELLLEIAKDLEETFRGVQ
jgi:hypothetical protein